MTIWFYIKTTDTPKAVGDAVCEFNIFEDPHPKGKYSWVMQRSKGEEEYWQIMGKYEDIKEQSIVASVHRAGEAVVLGEVSDGLVPNFMDPLLEKYGFDKIHAIATTPKK